MDESLTNTKKRFRARKRKPSETPPDNFEDRILQNLLHLQLNEQAKFKNATQETDKSHKESQVSKNFRPHLDLETINLLEQYGAIISAPIRINQKFTQEAYLPSENGEGDYIVEGYYDRNNSLDGDVVYAMLKMKGGNAKNKSVVVVGIKEYVHNRICVGTILKSPTKIVLYPTDTRLPKVRINKFCLPAEFKKINCQDYLFSTRIVDWTDERYATGDTVTVLGRGGTIKAEREAIILKHDLDVTPYPEHLNKHFPAAESELTDDVLKERLEFGNVCVFTIDPATAKDLDDAVSCEFKEDGGFIVGVHIADVAHFLAEGTELDEAVSKRATTVYLVDEVYHMLPKDLCILCSLTPGKRKLAFSVFWDFSDAGDILSVSINKTAIQSCAQLSYEHVQAMLDGNDFGEIIVENGFSTDDIVKRVKVLNTLAKKLRAARVEAGALRIDQLKISFSLDDKGKPSAYTVHQQLDSHKLIEELALLANITVAQKIQEKTPDLALLRNHSPPKADYLNRLQTDFEKYGVVFDVSSSKALQNSINRYSWDSPSERSQVMIINNALTKPMQRANYFCSSYVTDVEEKGHYALSIPLYTHFTSPIRRYADIIVHRLLASVLNYRELPKYTPEYVQSVAVTCNKKKYSAKLAGDASSDLYLALFVGERGNLIVEAVVCHVAKNCFEALILSTGSHVKVFYNTIDGKVTVLKEDIHEVLIEWIDGPKQKISMFSVVNLELTRGKGILLDARLLPVFTST